ncbi:MAG TPA: MFS transporter [Methanospirillum sp.]|nr:MFS transporter [Methanospirillum sp.]
MGGIDGAILPIGVTIIVWDLGGDFASLLFLIEGIIFASALIICGRIGDNLGLKKVFLLGILMLTVGSALSAMAESMTWLLCSRVISSLGLTISLAVSLPLIMINIPPEKHGRSIGYSTMGMSIGSAIGPILCGGILQYAGWAPMFLVIVPIGLTILLVGWRIIPNISCTPGVVRYDIPGAFLIFLTFGIFSIGMNLGIQNANPLMFISALICSIMVGIFFVRRELTTPDPVVDIGFIMRRAIAIPLILAFLIYAVYRTSLYFIPVYLSEVLKISPVNAGIILSIVAIIPALGSPFVGLYIEGRGMQGIRFLLTISAIAGVISSLVMIVTGMINGLVAVIISLFLLGISFTCGYTTIYAYYYRSVPSGRIGMAGGILETSAELAAPIAVTLVQILFAGGILLESGGTVSAREIIWETIPGVQAIYIFCLILSLVILMISRIAPDPLPHTGNCQVVGCPE